MSISNNGSSFNGVFVACFANIAKQLWLHRNSKCLIYFSPQALTWFPILIVSELLILFFAFFFYSCKVMNLFLPNQYPEKMYLAQSWYLKLWTNSTFFIFPDEWQTLQTEVISRILKLLNTLEQKYRKTKLNEMYCSLMGEANSLTE